MRLREDLHRCVAFIGIGSGDDFVPVGTGFFVAYGDLRYLVTARHIVEQLEDHPFTVRVNRLGRVGTINWLCDPLSADPPKWHFSDDDTVDVAIMLFLPTHAHGDAETMSIPEEMFAGKDVVKRENIGVGDICYAVGLFRLMRGRDRNLPFVHTGNVGLLPGEEKIPTRNWRQSGPRTLQVEGYLVELVSLAGLSGSPIFVRPTFGMRDGELNDGSAVSALLANEQVFLLGLWQGSWDGDPDDTLRKEAGDYKVPVGIGVVTPMDKIIAVLESPAVTHQRAVISGVLQHIRAAKPD